MIHANDLPARDQTGLFHFSNEDPGFRRWASGNVRGYVMNRRSPEEFMLHFAFCLDLHDDHDKGQTLASAKVCAADRRALMQHAFELTAHAPVRCKTCNP